jgi:hypothetical protein
MTHTSMDSKVHGGNYVFISYKEDVDVSFLLLCL